MDNVSHSLAGWALSRGTRRPAPAGTTLALILASNLPDIDIVLRLRDEPTYLLFHRALTHSLLGLAVFPAILAAGLWWGYGRRTRFGWFLLLCVAGVALHDLYDVVTPWGTMLLYPFSLDRFALDWLFIIDPVTWALPVIVLLLSRWRPARRRALTVGWLALLGLYGTGAGVVHARLTARVRVAEDTAGRPVARAFASPRFGAPLRWTAIAVAPGSSPEPRIALYVARGLPPALRFAARLDAGFDDPLVRAVLATRQGQDYLWWAQVPVATVRRTDDTATVTLRDLRYSRSIAPTVESWSPFALHFDVDAATGRVLATRWGEVPWRD